MCGIVGCVGHREAVQFAIDGLEGLKYRGYDSMGIAFPHSLDNVTELQRESEGDYAQIWTPAGIKVVRGLGKKGLDIISDQLLPADSEATMAIGHTRWATHGSRTDINNAHPHISQAGDVAVVHNGVIENHRKLRGELEAEGVAFTSSTDTEVIPQLISYYIEQGDSPEQAFTKAVRRLEGAYAILAYMAQRPGTLYAARLGSPLVLGVNGREHFVSSDARVWVGRTKKAVYLEDHEMGVVSEQEGYETWQHDKRTTRPPEELSVSDEIKPVLDKERYNHWMLQEIYEQPETVRDAIMGRVYPSENLVKLGGLEDQEISEKLRKTDRIIITACGTSYHAGLIGERLFEEISGIPVEVKLASEFVYSTEPLSSTTAVLAVSQSGETADTRAAVEKANKLGLLTLGVNNSPGSTIDRITKAGVHCRAKKEVGVASTKAFTSQVTILAEMALALSKTGNELQQPTMNELVALPSKIEQILEDTTAIQAAAKKYAGYKDFVFIGRGYEYPTALEGALKLKEIAYINANAYASGELKHGPIAVIEENHPTFAIATNGSLYDKTLSNIEEIKSSGGPVIALATKGNEAIREKVDDVLYVPASTEQLQPILNAVVTQLFAYYACIERGYDPDMPRNLAKSVTVE